MEKVGKKFFPKMMEDMLIRNRFMINNNMQQLSNQVIVVFLIYQRCKKTFSSFLEVTLFCSSIVDLLVL
jgi:hypothetical protein